LCTPIDTRLYGFRPKIKYRIIRLSNTKKPKPAESVSRTMKFTVYQYHLVLSLRLSDGNLLRITVVFMPDFHVGFQSWMKYRTSHRRNIVLKSVDLRGPTAIGCRKREVCSTNKVCAIHTLNYRDSVCAEETLLEWQRGHRILYGAPGPLVDTRSYQRQNWTPLRPILTKGLFLHRIWHSYIETYWWHQPSTANWTINCECSCPLRTHTHTHIHTPTPTVSMTNTFWLASVTFNVVELFIHLDHRDLSTFTSNHRPLITRIGIWRRSRFFLCEIFMRIINGKRILVLRFSMY
jgi:hypothetical protein